MGQLIKEYDFTELGLKTLECRPGDRLKGVNYYPTEQSGTLEIKLEMDQPFLKPDSKLGICIDIDKDNKLITVAEVVKEEKNANFYFVYTLRVTEVAAAGATILTIGNTTQADVENVILLDYDHIWEKSYDNNGNYDYIQYYFDNTIATATNNYFAKGSADRELYYEGMWPGQGPQYKTTTYPIVDFFHDEFIHVIENKAMVWMRRKSGGGVDKLTYRSVNYGASYQNGTDDYKSRNPSGAINTVAIPDTEYHIVAARPRDLSVGSNVTEFTYNTTKTYWFKDITHSSRSDDINMQATMAKFVGWPMCEVSTITGGAQKYKDADPFFFLKPTLDMIGNTLTTWDADSRITYPKTSFYINGAHAIPTLTYDRYRAGCYQSADGVSIKGKWSVYTPAEQTYTPGGAGIQKYTWVPNAQEIAGIGGRFVPGDGNEYYNVKFWRNDGDAESPTVLLNSKQGLRFDNCDFLSIWDGYSDKYKGSTEVAPALIVSNSSYDNVFNNCTFEVKTTVQEVAYKHIMNNLVVGTGTDIVDYTEEQIFSADKCIFGDKKTVPGGKAEYSYRLIGGTDGGCTDTNNIKPNNSAGYNKLGGLSAAIIKDSGNITFNECSFTANFGQNCLTASNTDNLTILGSKAETYYHNTENLYRDFYDFNQITPSDVTLYNNYITSLNAYVPSLQLFRYYVKLFGSTDRIIVAFAGGNNASTNPFVSMYSWATINAANSALTDKKTKETAYIAAYQAAPFKKNQDNRYKPKGFWIKDESSSCLIKGTNFYGEGIGFLVENLTNRHYIELEDTRVDTYMDEAYIFRDVNYPKLRNCWGHTIAHSVFRFESCIKPVQYNCKAESDTGFGFEFIAGSPTANVSTPFPTDMWRVNDCHIFSGSGLEFDPESMPAKIDFGTFIQTANSKIDSYVLPDSVGTERSLVGIKLYDAPYKATLRNLYFKGIKNDIDIYKGDNVELYLENSHFNANREVHGTYSAPAYFIHKGFSGVWEYRDIGGTITTSAVSKMKKDGDEADQNAGFSLAFKSYTNNLLGRNTIVLGNSNDETQYLNLTQGLNKITVFLMARLLDVEKPLTNQDIWLELRYKDRAPGDPHVTTASTRGHYTRVERIEEDTDHRNRWLINGEVVPNAKEFKIDLIVKAGQDCSCPLAICYEYFTTVGEIYIDPYARIVQLDDQGFELQ